MTRVRLAISGRRRTSRAVRRAVSALLAAIGVVCCLDGPTGASRVRAGDGIIGLWLVEDGAAQVRVEPCGDGDLCGRIVWLEEPLDAGGRQRRDVENREAALREGPVLGLTILTRVPRVPNDDGVWTDARIYDPRNGKTYKCKLELEADGRLKLRGYVGFSLFGRTTRWTRVDDRPEVGEANVRAVWIDADTSVAPGGHEVDDGLALVQAFHSPELEVRGVSTVFGNAPLDRTYPIGQEVVRRFGPSGLEVFEGAAGSDALGVETAATRAMVAALRRERLTLVAIGPVTNVATVLLNHSELAGQVEEIVAVAGRRPGERFTVGARLDARALRDLNFELDAEGFQALLDTEVPLTLAPFEISSKVLFTPEDAARLAEGRAVLGWFREPLADWLDLWVREFGSPGFHPFDTLAIAYLTSPDWVTCEILPVEIQQRPDDTWSGDGEAPHKPYLIVSRELSTSRRLRYCYDVASEFLPDLVARLTQCPMPNYQ